MLIHSILIGYVYVNLDPLTISSSSPSSGSLSSTIIALISVVVVVVMVAVVLAMMLLIQSFMFYQNKGMGFYAHAVSYSMIVSTCCEIVQGSCRDIIE